jgi:hypothetical protein
MREKGILLPELLAEINAWASNLRLQQIFLR